MSNQLFLDFIMLLCNNGFGASTFLSLVKQLAGTRVKGYFFLLQLLRDLCCDSEIDKIRRCIVKEIHERKTLHGDRNCDYYIFTEPHNRTLPRFDVDMVYLKSKYTVSLMFAIIPGNLTDPTVVFLGAHRKCQYRDKE